MTPQEKDTIRAIINAIDQPRNRFGKIEHNGAANDSMRKYAIQYELPHGGSDMVDQACMILKAMVGEKPRSILDR